MPRKLQIFLRCSKVVLLGLLTSLLTILILFTISTNWYEQNTVNSKQPIHPIKIRKSVNGNLAREFKFTDQSQSSYWTVLPNNVVVHVGTYYNPHNYSYILNNSAMCQSFDQSRIRVLIFIESHVEHHDRRKEIRNTWGVRMLQFALNFRIIFLLGETTSLETQELIRQEYFLYGDILQENFPESFNNLGLKSVMGLKWSSQFCRHADYVMKTDDDIFIHIPNLIKILTSMDKHEPLLICHRNRVRKIIRKNLTLEKYEVLPKDLPGMYFPEYCAGFGYLMSMDAVDKLYEASLKIPYFFIEDVYITGFCRYKANIKLIDHSLFSLHPRLTPAQTSCAFADGRVTSQELLDNELPMLWEQLNTQGFFCPQPIS